MLRPVTWGRRRRLTLRLAHLAALRLVFKLLVVEEELLTGGEGEILTAIDALKDLVLELHRPYPFPDQARISAKLYAPLAPGQLLFPPGSCPDGNSLIAVECGPGERVMGPMIHHRPHLHGCVSR